MIWENYPYWPPLPQLPIPFLQMSPPPPTLGENYFILMLLSPNDFILYLLIISFAGITKLYICEFCIKLPLFFIARIISWIFYETPPFFYTSNIIFAVLFCMNLPLTNFISLIISEFCIGTPHFFYTSKNIFVGIFESPLPFLCLT